MKKITLLAALVCGVSFSSMAANESTAVETASSTSSVDSNASSTFSSAHLLNGKAMVAFAHIEDVKAWPIDLCGQQTNFIGTRAQFDEYVKWIMDTHC